MSEEQERNKGGRGNFFAVGKPQWATACECGLNAAVAYLVLARGTGRDNATTSWSAEAVYQHSGISWRRAKEAIGNLFDHGIGECIQGGSRPKYKLSKPDQMDELIWLPNELVTGAAGEVPPVTRVRQAQEPEALQLLVELYGEHELTGDGGLPRSLIHEVYERSKIADWKQYTVWGFNSPEHRTCTFSGPLSRFLGRKKGTVWEHIKLLESLGLLETVLYLAESDSQEAELIHPITGDEHANNVASAAEMFASELPGGFSYEAENYDFVLPVARHFTRAALVGVSRLRYRPKTSRTAAWYGQHVEVCRQFSELYGKATGGNLTQVA